jgi:hypothetical protein
MTLDDLASNKLEGFLGILIQNESDTENLIWSFRNRIAEGIMCLKVRGKKCQEFQSMFDEFSAALQFPYYFGENWAAFDECLNDLEWLPFEKFLLFVSDAPYLLRNENDGDFRDTITLLQNTAANWKNLRNKSFYVVLHAGPSDDAVLKKKLEAGSFIYAEIHPKYESYIGSSVLFC